MFNGHELNALEVLGATPDMQLDAVTRLYQELLKNSDISTYDFYEAAYMAVLKAIQNQTD